MDQTFRAFAGVAGLFILSGCASVPPGPVTAPSTTIAAAPLPAPKGVQHKVRKGETLWRIARTYNVPLDDIIRANAIPNAASIEPDQLIVIPGAAAVQTVEPVVPDDKDSDYAWPVRGKVISYFEDHRGGVVNQGIDVSAVEADLVKAARPGRVVLADRIPGSGHTVIIDHGDGFYTVYAHNERLMVQLGDYVFKGEKIAQVAREGDLAYVHFEVRKGQRPTNPLYYLP